MFIFSFSSIDIRLYLVYLLARTLASSQWLHAAAGSCSGHWVIFGPAVNLSTVFIAMLSCGVSVTAVFWMQTQILLFWDTGQLHSDALLFLFKNEKVCKRDQRIRLSRLRFDGLQGFCDGNEIYRGPQIGAERSDVSLSASETTDARNGEVSFWWYLIA